MDGNQQSKYSFRMRKLVNLHFNEALKLSKPKGGQRKKLYRPNDNICSSIYYLSEESWKRCQE